MQKVKRILGRWLNRLEINYNWFVFKCFRFKPRVLSCEETIEMIIKNDLSISRYGDGEFRLMSRRGQIGFQDLDVELSEKLLSSFATRHKRLLICSYDFKMKRPMRVESGKWLRLFVAKHYKYFGFFDRKYVYGNTDISRFYQPDCFSYTDFQYLGEHYIPLLKKIWEGKKLLIVEGQETKLGVGNDLFDNAISIRRIECPPRNAFDSYDEILKSVVKHRKDDELVICALGPTASVLAVDLTIKHNIRTIDIGHVDIVYLWYLNKSKTKMPVLGKYVNEASLNEEIIEINATDDWKKEIVDTIYGK